MLAVRSRLQLFDGSDVTPLQENGPGLWIELHVSHKARRCQQGCLGSARQVIEDEDDRARARHIVKAGENAGTLRLGTTDAYVLERLTGHFATNTTTASRTSLMNLRTCEWDEELCRLFGATIKCLPEIRPTVGDFGSVGRVPLTASLVDQQAALYGHRCCKSGDAKITFGTGAFALALTGKYIVCGSDQGLLPTVAWHIGN
ncbi:glycerol kinase [Caballeronia arvi]|uniref:Glycerol kinase n=1 Tax=Caballeronia arvi TaxID=1777135 RepID=A0A158KZ93_9BURK|nr:FGGY family carbohydrate kinase [Caballeronia arvi]SAL86305.1 glycerol kinase [Caballeronia arvi]